MIAADSPLMFGIMRPEVSFSSNTAVAVQHSEVDGGQGGEGTPIACCSTCASEGGFGAESRGQRAAWGREKGEDREEGGLDLVAAAALAFSFLLIDMKRTCSQPLCLNYVSILTIMCGLCI
jgi:hypothetical protein